MYAQVPATLEECTVTSPDGSTAYVFVFRPPAEERNTQQADFQPPDISAPSADGMP